MKLENKTKVELLDIIDRKDNVERSLRDMIETLNNAIETEKINYNDVVKRFDNLKKDMDGMCVELEKARNDKKECTKVYNMLFENYKSLESNYEVEVNARNILQNDYENICDILATERAEHSISNRNYFIVNAILILALIVITTLYISNMY